MSSPPRRTDRLRCRAPSQALWHQGTRKRGKKRATLQAERPAIAAFNENQTVASVRESGRGSGVEVKKRDHDDDRERDEGVIAFRAASAIASTVS